MRFLLAWLALHSLGLAATSGDKLDDLKRAFPLPMTGEVTAKTDGVTRQTYTKYKTRVDRLTWDSLGEGLFDMRKAIHNDIINFERMLANRHQAFDDQTRAAIRRNITWLKQRVDPWLTRAAQVQRGR